MTTQQLGDWIAVTINQAIRECHIVEVLPKYALAIYTMPAGRAFLTRLPHEFDDTRRPFDNASKKERDRHAKALIEAEIEACEIGLCDHRGGRLHWSIKENLKRAKEALARLNHAAETADLQRAAGITSRTDPT